MSSIIWKNEINSFEKIAQVIKTDGRIAERNVGLMPDEFSFDEGKRVLASAETHIYKNRDGNDVVLSENASMASITYVYDENMQVSICYDKSSNRIGYLLHSKSIGDRLLACVSEDKKIFPIQVYKNYSEPKNNEGTELENSPTTINAIIENISPTVIKNLNESLEKDESLTDKEKSLILKGYNQLIGINQNREIIPLSVDDVKNHFIGEINNLKDSNKQLFEDLIIERESKKQNIALKESGDLEIESLRRENETLHSQNEELKKSLTSANEDLEGAQKLLKKAYAFITRVRNNVLGKVFFRKDLKNLDMQETLLPHGSSGDNLPDR